MPIRNLSPLYSVLKMQFLRNTLNTKVFPCGKLRRYPVSQLASQAASEPASQPASQPARQLASQLTC